VNADAVAAVVIVEAIAVTDVAKVVVIAINQRNTIQKQMAEVSKTSAICF
jgi:hypothetical protein